MRHLLVGRINGCQLCKLEKKKVKIQSVKAVALSVHIRLRAKAWCEPNPMSSLGSLYRSLINTELPKTSNKKLYGINVTCCWSSPSASVHATCTPATLDLWPSPEHCITSHVSNLLLIQILRPRMIMFTPLCTHPLNIYQASLKRLAFLGPGTQRWRTVFVL